MISRDIREELVNRMREKLKSEEGKRIYTKRMSMVEPPFGNIKRNLGVTYFLLRGIGKIRGEFSLMCIANNLKKIHIFKQKIKKAV